MPDHPPDADHVADLLLPVDGPHPPDRVIETARTINELVRRLNHATRHSSALGYPPQLWRAITPLASAANGLRQTLAQLAARLDAFAADPRVEHDERRDPALACATAAARLRRAAANTRLLGAPLDEAGQITGHLGYDTTTTPRRTRPQVIAAIEGPRPPQPPAGPAQRGRTR